MLPFMASSLVVNGLLEKCFLAGSLNFHPFLNFGPLEFQPELDPRQLPLVNLPLGSMQTATQQLRIEAEVVERSTTEAASADSAASWAKSNAMAPQSGSYATPCLRGFPVVTALQIHTLMEGIADVRLCSW